MDEKAIRDLIERAAGGEAAAMNELVQRYDGPLRAVIRRRLGDKLRNRLETDDIFQSAVVDALGQLPKFEYRSEREFVGWLAAIAERRMAMQARFHGAEKREINRGRRMLTREDFNAALTAPPDRAAKGEAADRLRQAIEQLPEPDREVVHLHSVQNLNFVQIAEQLGLADKDAARYIFRRALKTLSGKLS